MGCPTREQLSAYVDGGLTPDERADIEAHIVECDSCAAELSWLEQVRAAAAYADSMLPPVEEGLCLAAEDLAEYAEGRGGPGFRGRVERHLTACADCRRTVGYLSVVATETGVAVSTESTAAARAEKWQRIKSALRTTFVPTPIWSAPVYGFLGVIVTLLLVAVVLPKTGHPLPFVGNESASQIPGANPQPGGMPESNMPPDMPGAPGGTPGMPDMPLPPGGGPGGMGGPSMPPSPPSTLPPMPPDPGGLMPPPPLSPGGSMMAPPAPGGRRSASARHSGGASHPSGGGMTPPPSLPGPPPAPASENTPSFWDQELSSAAKAVQSDKVDELQAARAKYEAFLRHPSGNEDQRQNAWANYAKVCNKLRENIDVTLKPEPGRVPAPVVVLDPPLRVGGVDTAVIGLYGDPTSRSGDPIKGEVLRYDNRGLMFTVQNGKLQSIVLRLPSAGAVDGVRVGDRADTVQGRFGDPGSKDSGEGYVQWKYPARGLIITMRDKVVFKIEVKEPAS